MKKNSIVIIMSLLLAASMLLSACAPAVTQTPAAVVEPQIIKETQVVKETVVVQATAAPTAAPVYEGPYLELAKAKAGEYKGTKVSIFGNYTAEDEARFRAALVPFAMATGIDVQFEGSPDFAQLITVRVGSGDAPDIAEMSQPALMQQFAKEGKLVDLTPFMSMDQLKKDYIQSWLDYGTVDGKLYGIFYRASTKSIVWYPLPQFTDAGYKIPQTWDEMIALSDQIVKDGSTPWCISIEHSSATGWVATDWLEEIVLRTAGPEVYDKWIKHEIPFNAPEIKAAAEKMGQIWLNPKYVYGGTKGILTTWVGATQNPMFDKNGPKCWLHRQAGWYSGFFPAGKVAGVDSTYFYLPGIDPKFGKPVEGAGDLLAMFNDRPEVRAVMQYLATPEGTKVWTLAGNFIPANRSVPLDWISNAMDRTQAEILQKADVFRFDASDLMPPEVGTGSFYTGMVDWISGAKDLDTVLADIEASWPKN